MRLFIAVNLPDEERARLHDSVACLRGARLPVRWVACEALHLTLRFLGEVPKPRVAAIVALLDAVGAAAPPIPLGLGGVGGFPGLANPRVVWMGVTAPPALIRLQADLERRLATLGFEPERRAFTPHLTLGRARRDARSRDFRELTRLAESVHYHATVTVRSLDLMRSHLGPAGASYERIAKAPLTVLQGQ